MATPTGLTVRPVRWGDFDDLREMYFRLYDERATGAAIGITLFADRPTIADEVGWFEGHFRKVLDGDEIFLVAEIGGHAVGSVTIGRATPGTASEQSHVGELGILVDHDHRGMGAGTALLERALAEARSKFEVVYLSVFSINEGAQRLYRRFGFSACGHLPRAVKRGGLYFDQERMVLDFSSPPGAAGANR
ncbi:MAG: GNAT family N-acetyltransferase [Thermoplasmata archaeon]